MPFFCFNTATSKMADVREEETVVYIGTSQKK